MEPSSDDHSSQCGFIFAAFRTYDGQAIHFDGLHLANVSRGPGVDQQATSIRPTCVNRSGGSRKEPWMAARLSCTSTPMIQ